MFREPWQNTIGHEQKPDIGYGVVVYYVAVFIYECTMTPNKYLQCAFRALRNKKAVQYSLHILYCIRSEHNMQSFRSEFPVAFGCIYALQRNLYVSSGITGQTFQAERDEPNPFSNCLPIVFLITFGSTSFTLT